MTISRESLQEMFDGIAAKPGWDMSRPMLWGYFFTDPDKAALEHAADLLAQEGYTVVEIHPTESEDAAAATAWWLHVERVEPHSVDSLDARNRALEAFAERHGLASYDGMDVGPAHPNN